MTHRRRTDALKCLEVIDLGDTLSVGYWRDKSIHRKAAVNDSAEDVRLRAEAARAATAALPVSTETWYEATKRDVYTKIEQAANLDNNNIDYPVFLTTGHYDKLQRVVVSPNATTPESDREFPSAAWHLVLPESAQASRRCTPPLQQLEA